jgi:hypothetical protein
VDNAQARAFYFVKLDDTKQSRYEWYKVGTLRTDSSRDGEATFTLPDDLARATGFNICLKNTATDDLLCNNSSLTKLADRSDDDDDDDDKDAKFRGTFTVSRQSGRITIETITSPRTTSTTSGLRKSPRERRSTPSSANSAPRMRLLIPTATI